MEKVARVDGFDWYAEQVQTPEGFTQCTFQRIPGAFVWKVAVRMAADRFGRVMPVGHPFTLFIPTLLN